MARILIVEDEPSNAEIAFTILMHAGHEVTIAVNGQIALDLLAHQPVDLVLMDVLMPAMDGLAATRAIRRDPALAHLPIVGVTAVIDPTMGQTLLAAGMNAVLTKPYRNRELREIVDVHLAGRSKRGTNSLPAAPTMPKPTFGETA